MEYFGTLYIRDSCHFKFDFASYSYEKKYKRYDALKTINVDSIAFSCKTKITGIEANRSKVISVLYNQNYWNSSYSKQDKSVLYIIKTTVIVAIQSKIK